LTFCAFTKYLFEVPVENQRAVTTFVTITFIVSDLKH